MAIKSITLISTDANGVQGNGRSTSPKFSPDSSKVVFSSYASNLVPDDTTRASDVFVKDLATGAIKRVSTDANGAEGNDTSHGGVFSPDGSKVAFWSYASTRLSAFHAA